MFCVGSWKCAFYKLLKLPTGRGCFWLWALCHRSVETHSGNSAVKIRNAFGEERPSISADLTRKLLHCCLFVLLFSLFWSFKLLWHSLKTHSLVSQGMFLTGERVRRLPGLSRFSPLLALAKLILVAERSSSFILLKSRKRDFNPIVSAPLGVLSSFLIKDQFFSSLSPSTFPKRIPWITALPYQFDITLFYSLALELPYCVRLQEIIRNFCEWLDYSKGQRVSQDQQLALHISWITGFTQSPWQWARQLLFQNGLPVKMSRDEDCANNSFATFMVNHDACICLYSFLTRIHAVSSSRNVTMGWGKESAKVTAACWGSSEQPELWISWNKSNLA